MAKTEIGDYRNVQAFDEIVDYLRERQAVFALRLAALHFAEDDAAQTLAFGERVVGLGVALGMIDAFFEEEFAGGRHATRVNGIKDIEEKHFK